MKRLVVFCDGTWNDTRMSSLTNVARLAKCVVPEDDRDHRRDRDQPRIPQVVFYDSGVGVAQNVSRFTDFLTRVQGGAFGRGLDEKIEAAYRFLVLNYEVGDEIFVFGFSRGAYTARSLCGLVRKCGIVRRDCFDRIPQAIGIYRDRATLPHEISAFRKQYAHQAPDKGFPLASGGEDLADDRKDLWPGRYPVPSFHPVVDDRHRGDDSAEPPPGGPSPGDDSPAIRDGASRDWLDRKALVYSRDRDVDFAHRQADAGERIYKMMYLGLWDTVGALGIPTRFRFLSRLLNRRYRFHDTDASSLITAIRHAVSVDEDRRAFDVSPISNITPLNQQWASAMALSGPLPYNALPYQQRWFPGDHGAVGGGNPEPGLSSAALLWIAEGAQIEGLYLQEAPLNELAEARRLRNPLASWRINGDGTRKPSWLFDGLGFAGGYRDRKGPLTPPKLHEATEDRIRGMDGYRPGPLERFTGAVARPPVYRLLSRLAFPPVVVLLLAAAVLAGAALLALVLNGWPMVVPTLREWAGEAWTWVRAAVT